MLYLSVRALLYSNDTIVLLRRCNTGFGDGLYSLAGGKIEPNIPARHAIKQKVSEETALDIPESEFQLKHVFHRKSDEREFLVLCFCVNISALNLPRNNKPEKYDDIQFFRLNQLPENILLAHKQAIECIEKNITYSEHGW